MLIPLRNSNLRSASDKIAKGRLSDLLYLILSFIIAILATLLWLLYKKTGNLQKQHKQILQKLMEETAITVEEKELNHQEQLKEIKVKSKLKLYELRKDHQKKLEQSEQDHTDIVNDLKDQIDGLKKQARNTGEVATLQILQEWKNAQVRHGILKDDEFHIIPNIFIPNEIDEGTNRQVDHLLLSRTGIYVIETKYWQGKVVHGLSKKRAGIFSFLLGAMNQNGNGHNKEKTLVFVPKIIDDESGNTQKIIQIHSYGEPVSQAKVTAVVTKQFLDKHTNIKNLYVTPVVYFGYPQNTQKMNDFLDLSESDVHRFSTKQGLKDFLDRENQKDERFTIRQLQQIKEIVENINFIKN